MLTVTRPWGVRRGSITPFCVLSANHVFAGQSLVTHKTRKATRAIATLLTWAPSALWIEVEQDDTYTPAEQGSGQRPETKMAVTQKAVMRCSRPRRPSFVEHDKVVASPYGAVTFAHNLDYPHSGGIAPQSGSRSCATICQRNAIRYAIRLLQCARSSQSSQTASWALR